MRTEKTRSYSNLPEPDEIAQRARAARAAILSGAVKYVLRQVSASFRELVEARRRARRAQETYRQLSRLSDRDLNDIGLSRAEIDTVAEALAAEPRDARLTIADLRQTWRTPLEERGVKVASPSDSSDWIRWPDPRTVRPANTSRALNRAA